MNRKLKVYGFGLGGTERAIIATTSVAKAAEAFGVSANYIRIYGCPTGNEEERRVALANPELPIKRQERGARGPWQFVAFGKAYEVIGEVQP